MYKYMHMHVYIYIYMYFLFVLCAITQYLYNVSLSVLQRACK